MFLTVNNIVECINVFKEYMNKAYAITVEEIMNNQELKEAFYHEMVTLSKNDSFKNHSIKDKNNYVMNILKHRILNMQRENIPEITEKMSSIKDTPNLMKDFDSLVNSRNNDFKYEKPSVPSQLTQTISDIGMNETEMMSKIKSLDKRLASNIEISEELDKQSKVSNNKKIYESLLIKTNDNQNSSKDSTIKEYVLPKPKSTSKEIYLSINSVDRDWKVYKMRYNYVVNFSSKNDNAIVNCPKNIESIKVTSITIPAEICEKRTYRNVPKICFQHDFDFQYPYVILRIDELPSIYEGTNKNVRNCFCKLGFDKTYRTPNGRGYTVLKAIQDEKLVFYPNVLPNIQKLTFSILKPNGTLFNNSQDDYQLFKIEYEQFNPLHLKVICNKYFDKNEFYLLDHIIIKNYQLEESSIDLKRFVQFVNRDEGHDIVELGQPNDEGYYNSFYILAPGTINQNIGSLTEDMDAINALVKYNESRLWDQIISNGEIINGTLQNVIHMKFSTNVPDPIGTNR